LKAAKKSKPRPAAKPAAAHVVYNTPLPKKLGIKPGFAVALLKSPAGFATKTLKPLPAKVSFTALPDPGADLFICFARTAPELQAHILSMPATVRTQTMWLAWPKKASGVASDLDGNVVRTTGLAAGWVDFKVCSVDATWSALAFKRKK
jgi:hypothetical protein